QVWVTESPPAAPNTAPEPPRLVVREAEPKRAKPARDWYGDPLPLGAVARLGTSRFRHGGPVSCVAITPDGKTVASGSEAGDKTVRGWDAATGKEIYRLDLSSGILALAFSHDGQTFAVGTQGKAVHLVDGATGQELRILQGHEQDVSAVLFCPDDETLITASYDGTVHLWQVATGKEVCRFTVAGNKVHCLALSRDGRTLAAGCEERTGR